MIMGNVYAVSALRVTVGGGFVYLMSVNYSLKFSKLLTITNTFVYTLYFSFSVFLLCIINVLYSMSSVLEKDAEYSDGHFDLNSNEKRLIRVAVKNYEKTGTYLSLKLFKREQEDAEYKFEQTITLSADEFQLFVEKLPKTRRMLGSNKSEKLEKVSSTTKERPTKKRRVELTPVNLEN